MTSHNSFKREFSKVSPAAQTFIVETIAAALESPTERYHALSVEQFMNQVGLGDAPSILLRDIVREAQQVLCSFESGTDEDPTFQSWTIFDEVFIFDGKVHYQLGSSMYSLEMASLSLQPYPQHHKTLLKYEEYFHTK